MVRDIIFQVNFLRIGYRALKWHLRYWFLHSACPLACGFYLTSKCNFQCEFCNIWRIQPHFQFSEADAQKIIEELGKMGLIYFSFSGGEPLLVPYVFDLLAHAKKLGILYTHLVSNGFLMDESRAKKMAEAHVSEISFSLDGEENAHDQNRNMKGAFQKVLEAIDCVKIYAPKTKIVLNTILDPVQPESALFVVNLAEKLGIKIKLQPINDHPAFGLHNCAAKSSRFLQDEEKQRLLKAIDLIQRSPQVVNSKPFLKNYLAFLFSPERLIFAQEDCLFGYHHVELFNKQIFPCLEGFHWQAGFDVLRQPLANIIKSENYRASLKELRKCDFCKKNYYVCYYEPRLNFPVWNFLKSRLNKS